MVPKGKENRGENSHDWAPRNSWMFSLILPIYFIGARSRVSGHLCHWYHQLLNLALCTPGTILSVFGELVNKLLNKHYWHCLPIYRRGNEGTEKLSNYHNFTTQKAEVGFEPIQSGSSQISQSLSRCVVHTIFPHPATRKVSYFTRIFQHVD